MPIEIRRLRQIFVVPDDLAVASRFFEETLGLPLQFRDGERWAQFKAGEVSLALAAPEEGLGAPRNTPVPVFEVDSLDACAPELRAAGCELGEVRDMGAHGRTLPVREPNGALLVFFEKPGGRA